MLSLVFIISLKFFRASKKVVIISFCCFWFLNYGVKVGLLRVDFLETSNVFLERQSQK